MLTGLLLSLLAVQLVVPLLLYAARNRVIFIPSDRPTPQEGLRYLRGEIEVELTAIGRPDGRDLAAYDAHPTGGRDPDGPVVLYFHGNAGNLGSRAPLLEMFVAGTGSRTLLFDYSGYGGNPGSPSELEVTRDGLAAYDHLRAEGVEPGRIVLYGESLGAAVALAVAAERECAAVVTQSAFSSLSSIAGTAYRWLPLVRWLARGSFPNDRRAAALDVPLLIAHGTRDRIIPFAEAQRLHAAAPGSELLAIEGAGHNDFLTVAGIDYLERLGGRLRAWSAAAGGRPRDSAGTPPPTER